MGFIHPVFIFKCKFVSINHWQQFFVLSKSFLRPKEFLSIPTYLSRLTYLYVLVAPFLWLPSYPHLLQLLVPTYLPNHLQMPPTYLSLSTYPYLFAHYISQAQEPLSVLLNAIIALLIFYYLYIKVSMT